LVARREPGIPAVHLTIELNRITCRSQNARQKASEEFVRRYPGKSLAKLGVDPSLRLGALDVIQFHD
jgi:hypothetical protein